MCRFRLLIISGFIFLLIYWSRLNQVGLTHSIWNSMFGLCLAVYALLVGLNLAFISATSKSISKYKTSFISLCLGYSFFGMGTLSWFYIEYITVSHIPFPSFADVFYIIQLPLLVFSIIIFDRRDKIKALWDSILVSLSVLAVVLMLSLYLFGVGNIARVFFLIYFPFESFFVFVVSGLKYIKVNDYYLKIYLFGNLIWFIADILFIYRYLENTFYSGGFADLLYFLSTFLVFLSLSSFVQKRNLVHFINESPTFVQKSKIWSFPISLN